MNGRELRALPAAGCRSSCLETKSSLFDSHILSTDSCLLIRAAVTGTGCIVAGLTNVTATGQPYLNSNGATIIGLSGEGSCYDFLATGLLINYPFQQMELSCKDTNGDGLLDFHVAASFAQNDGEYYYCPLRNTRTTSFFLI